MFAVLAIVLKLVSQFTDFGIFKLTLVYSIWLMAAATLGVLGGGAVCFVSDILIALVFPNGPINPYLTVGSTLFGVIAALVFKYTPSKSYAVRFVASGVASTVICTCGINSIALYYSYYSHVFDSFWLFFLTSRIWQPLIAAINIGITVSMIPLLKKLYMLPDINKKKKDTGGSTMPNISVKMLEGRTQAQKEKLAKDLVEVLSRDLGADKRWITCTVEDYTAEEWQEVFKTEIAEKPDSVVFKKPEYDPKILL